MAASDTIFWMQGLPAAHFRQCIKLDALEIYLKLNMYLLAHYSICPKSRIQQVTESSNFQPVTDRVIDQSATTSIKRHAAQGDI